MAQEHCIRANRPTTLGLATDPNGPTASHQERVGPILYPSFLHVGHGVRERAGSERIICTPTGRGDSKKINEKRRNNNPSQKQK